MDSEVVRQKWIDREQPGWKFYALHERSKIRDQKNRFHQHAYLMMDRIITAAVEATCME